MARIKLSVELKEALSNLPHKEKDKLIFRLLPSNAALIEQLIFKLLEEGKTTDLRRNELMQIIESKIDFAISSYYSPGYLLLDLRECSGLINEHVRTTRDKYGELAISLMALNRCFAHLGAELAAAKSGRMQTLAPYVVKRSIKLLKLLAKMHEDVHFDFRQEFEDLAAHFKQNPHISAAAQTFGLDLEQMATLVPPEQIL